RVASAAAVGGPTRAKRGRVRMTKTPSPVGGARPGNPRSAMSATAQATTWKSRPQQTVSTETLERIDKFWRAANYLSVGQIYLLDNPLLREELRAEHVKPRLLGHWGTTPGLNFLYAHLNRVIKERA